jgi:hypothetical protein
VTNTGSNGKWQISKTIYADPSRPVAGEHVTFTALPGTLGDYVRDAAGPSGNDQGTLRGRACPG